MKRQKPKVGDIFRVKLENQSYTYGQVLGRGIHAFYKFTSITPPNLKEIISAPPLFCIMVMDFALKKNIWEIIGSLPIPEELSGTIEFCRQDMVSGELIISYTTEEGEHIDREGTLGECEHLEITAYWDTEHAEDRLNDFYNGKDDRWLKAMRFW